MFFRPALTVLLLTGALLTAAGCGSEPDPSDGGTPASMSPQTSSAPSISPSPSTASVSPSPTSSLTPAQHQAFVQAVDAVMAYRQIGVDLYSGARTDISDLDEVTTGAFRVQSEQAVARSLAKGDRIEPRGVTLTLVSAEPVKVNLKKARPTVVVRACIDGTSATSVDAAGTRTPGSRGQLDYTVVYTTDWANPVWAVSGATGASDPKDRAC